MSNNIMVQVDKKKVIGLVAILIIILAVFFLSRPKNCGTDNSCFNSAAAKCSKAEVTTFNKNSEYHYEILGKKKDNCIIEATLLDLSDDQTADIQNALEGKSMKCSIPITLLQTQTIDKIENISDLCSGQLKEATLQITADKMYEIIVQNIGPIALEFQKELLGQ